MRWLFTFGFRRPLPYPTLPATNLRLSPAFESSGIAQSARLRLAPSIVPSGLAGLLQLPTCVERCILQPIRQSIPDSLLGHQLNETLLPLNLWMQVQKSS
jgi:hypothetical protein